MSYQPEHDPYLPIRERMVAEQLAARSIVDARVLDAMRTIPRHLFVPEELQARAYEDRPLPIGAGQTISQPYMVALMTQLLHLDEQDRVLEIGVGSGYQTAVLSYIAGSVIGIERIPSLAKEAERRLQTLGCENVEIVIGDGSLGYAPAAPYTAILVAAAAPYIPRALFDQLADRGRLVIPVGLGDEQVLEYGWRRGGSFHIQRTIGVRFVPLIGEEGFDTNDATC